MVNLKEITLYIIGPNFGYDRLSQNGFNFQFIQSETISLMVINTISKLALLTNRPLALVTEDIKWSESNLTINSGQDYYLGGFFPSLTTHYHSTNQIRARAGIILTNQSEIKLLFDLTQSNQPLQFLQQIITDQGENCKQVAKVIDLIRFLLAIKVVDFDLKDMIQIFNHWLLNIWSTNQPKLGQELAGCILNWLTKPINRVSYVLHQGQTLISNLSKFGLDLKSEFKFQVSSAEAKSLQYGQIFTDKHSQLLFCMKMGNPSAEAILQQGIFEYNLIKWSEQYLTPQSTFIDIGAHIGTYAIILSQCCQEVHAFEAQFDTYNCLSIGVNLNQITNIKIHNVALAGQDGGKNYLFHSSADGGSSSLREDVAKKSGLTVTDRELVELRTLDSYAISNVDFIKIDVEGAELEVIKGAFLTLVNNRFPPFVFEAWPNDWYQRDREQLFSWIRNLGYKIHPIRGISNMYLASDHSLRVQPSQAEPDESSNIADLDQRFSSGHYDEITDWHDWYRLAQHYRFRGDNKKSYECINHSFSCSPPTDKDYLLYNELVIVCYYLDKKLEGMQAADKVVLSTIAPWSMRNTALGNQSFYMKKLNFKRTLTIDYQLPTDYIASSSSIIAVEGGYRFNIRAVNYTIAPDGHYIIRDKASILRTRNFLLNLDHDFKVKKARELTVNSSIQLYNSHIMGLEDIRLFGPNYFFCTTWQVNQQQIHQMCLGSYNDQGQITKLVPLQVGPELKPEKNWLPFIKDKEIYFIYTIGPFRLYKVEPETGQIKLVKETIFSDDKTIYLQGSGSAGPIPYQNGWLCTIHQRCDGPPHRYFHRLVWLDRDFTSLKYSRFFYFEKLDIEFNLSLCHSAQGLIMTYSVHDASNAIGLLDYQELDKLISSRLFFHNLL